MCCWSCFTCCYGGDCGYCSECVDTAACNTELCSMCMTGTCQCVPVCTPTMGSGPCICTNTSTSCCISCVDCLPFAGTDENGNDIYQNNDGSLRYTDGSPATRSDIAYNCGACKGTPCSPHTCGTTTQPPSSRGGASSGGAPSGGGSGGGSAKPSGGGAQSPKNCTQVTKLTQAMAKFGSSLTSLLAGGKRTTAAKMLPGQAVAKSNTAISPNAYLLVVVVVGALLLFLAFGHKPVAD